MAADFKRGDHVEWGFHNERIRGRIQKKATSDIMFKSQRRRASKAEPQYILKSDKTGKLTILKRPVLKKINK
jgi:hypothetical protein